MDNTLDRRVVRTRKLLQEALFKLILKGDTFLDKLVLGGFNFQVVLSHLRLQVVHLLDEFVVLSTELFYFFTQARFFQSL